MTLSELAKKNKVFAIVIGILIGALILLFIFKIVPEENKEINIYQKANLTLDEFQEICESCENYCGEACAETGWCIKRMYYDVMFGLRCVKQEQEQ